MEVTGARPGVSLISAIASKGHMRFMIKDKGGVNSDVFIEFFLETAAGRHEPRPIFLIVDRGPAHIAKKTKAFIEDSQQKPESCFPSRPLAGPQYPMSARRETSESRHRRPHGHDQQS